MAKTCSVLPPLSLSSPDRAIPTTLPVAPGFVFFFAFVNLDELVLQALYPLHHLVVATLVETVSLEQHHCELRDGRGGRER